MVPNGVNIQISYDSVNVDLQASFRSKFALPEEKIVLFVGRLVYRERAPSSVLDQRGAQSPQQSQTPNS